MIVHILDPCTLWQCSSLFTPPTSICCFSPHSLLHSRKFLIHIYIFVSYSVSLLVAIFFHPRSFFCSSPSFYYILYRSSKLCSSLISHSVVTFFKIADKIRFAHAYSASLLPGSSYVYISHNHDLNIQRNLIQHRGAYIYLYGAGIGISSSESSAIPTSE